MNQPQTNLTRMGIGGNRSGFTLVELLVVISIIALLISILLPVLRVAREAGHATACLSSQRQVGIAMQMYADAYDEYFPIWYSATDGALWTQVITEEDFLPENSNVLCCPLAPPHQFDETLGVTRGYAYTYGMPNYRNAVSATFLSTYPAVPAGDGTSYIVRTHIDRPSEVFLAADSVYTFSADFLLQTYVLTDTDSNNTLHLRHGNDRANTVKADGSAAREDEDFFRNVFPTVWMLHEDGTKDSN